MRVLRGGILAEHDIPTCPFFQQLYLIDLDVPIVDLGFESE